MIKIKHPVGIVGYLLNVSVPGAVISNVDTKVFITLPVG